MPAKTWDALSDEQRDRLLALVADPPEPEPEPEPSVEDRAAAAAGRPLVDLTVDELQGVARDVDLEGRSGMKRDELIVALGGDPDAMTEGERELAAAEQAERESAEAPEVDPNSLAPWERHEDVVEPVSTDEMLAVMAEMQGAFSEHTVDPETGERKVATWGDFEDALRARREAASTGSQ